MAKLSSGVREPAGYRWIVVGVSTAVSGLAWGARSGGGLGGAIGPFLGGWLFDRTGTYRLAFMAAGAAVAGSAVAAWFAARPVARTRDVVTSLAKSTGA